MSNLDHKVLILGAGHAGGTAAALLRQSGHTGPITLIGEEWLPPYQRPPLSKGWIQGTTDEDDLLLRPLEFYANNQIVFRPGCRALRIDRERREVILDDESTLLYDSLIIATGARNIPLRVPGSDLDGVLSLRTAADAEKLKAAMGPRKQLIVIGGGYIGLEVAASGRGLGAEVTLVEREPRLLSRVACGKLGDFFQRYHEQHGVHFVLNATVSEIRGKNGKVAGVALSDGRTFEADAVVVGVGAYPNEELAKDAGLECSRGIVVDASTRTSDPHIFAIGDVSYRPLPRYDRMFRLESVPNALEQARQAASAILGIPVPASEVPWQWSDQYDLKLQIAGYTFDADNTLFRGDPESSSSFAVFHLKENVIEAVEAINLPSAFIIGRQMIAKRTPVDLQKLQDTGITMKEIAAS